MHFLCLECDIMKKLRVLPDNRFKYFLQNKFFSSSVFIIQKKDAYFFAETWFYLLAILKSYLKKKCDINIITANIFLNSYFEKWITFWHFEIQSIVVSWYIYTYFFFHAYYIAYGNAI